MSCFRVTHVDVHHRRRRVRVQALNRLGAVAWVEQMFGDAWYIAAVRELGER